MQNDHISLNEEPSVNMQHIAVASGVFVIGGLAFFASAILVLVYGQDLHSAIKGLVVGCVGISGALIGGLVPSIRRCCLAILINQSLASISALPPEEDYFERF